MQNPQQNTNILNPAIYKKNYTPQRSRIYSRYVRLVQHEKINQCNPPHQHTKEEKSYDHINRCRKSIWQYLTPILDKNSQQGFPGGAVVENLPANAGDMGSSPGLGRSHMPQSGWACEPQLLSLRVWNLCSPTREAAIVRGPRTTMKSGPRLPQLEKVLTQKRRPNTAIN